MASLSYQVHLTDEASDAFGDDPVRADSVEFYDSGAWISHVDGRDFFPYERILRIREVETTTDSSQEPGERRDASSGTAGTVDDADLDVG
ncbi:hypothetical protein [Haloplanus halobius]|uniref:hypothetical protein n=1 Tax=Haloplanus halobius TaxID=2934938 RepID=UPI00200E8F7A|nr:hypothetical protein [Haloplanus sp. XH21]